MHRNQRQTHSCHSMGQPLQKHKSNKHLLRRQGSLNPMPVLQAALLTTVRSRTSLKLRIQISFASASIWTLCPLVVSCTCPRRVHFKHQHSMGTHTNVKATPFLLAQRA